MCLTNYAFDLRKTSNATANELSEFVNQTCNKEVNLISAEHITNLIIPILDLLHCTVCAIKDRNKATAELPVECDSC